MSDGTCILIISGISSSSSSHHHLASEVERSIDGESLIILIGIPIILRLIFKVGGWRQWSCMNRNIISLIIWSIERSHNIIINRSTRLQCHQDWLHSGQITIHITRQTDTEGKKKLESTCKYLVIIFIYLWLVHNIFDASCLYLSEREGIPRKLSALYRIASGSNYKTVKLRWPLLLLLLLLTTCHNFNYSPHKWFCWIWNMLFERCFVHGDCVPRRRRWRWKSWTEEAFSRQIIHQKRTNGMTLLLAADSLRDWLTEWHDFTPFHGSISGAREDPKDDRKKCVHKMRIIFVRNWWIN